MRYHLLATDYDGTLAARGEVSEETAGAIERLRATGRRTVLVTGRIASDLSQIFDRLELFDRVVAENGATLLEPGPGKERVLAAPPPEAFTRALAARGVPFVRGRVVVATREPHHHAALEVIREMGLELSVVFNKGSVMILPNGVSKATGLAAALADLALTPHEVVALGDAENDHLLLSTAECGVAVANALPPLKEAADLVTEGARGEGVRQVVAMLERDDLSSADPARRDVPLSAGGTGAAFRPGRDRVLIAGGSGSGKTTAATAVIERFLDRGYQLCVIDPEGDYDDFEGLTAVGATGRPPGSEEVLSLLSDPQVSLSVNLLGVKMNDRPAWFAGLLPRLEELRSRTGRPHLLVADEAHHLFPREGQVASAAWPADPGAVLLVTLSPGRIAPVVLRSLTGVVTIGEEAEEGLSEFLLATGRPELHAPPRRSGEALSFWVLRPQEVRPLEIEPPRATRHRHRRKYAHGDMREKAFRFRGRDGRLDLRARNLGVFLELAQGVDEDTWRFHLENGDVDGWLRDALKDPDAAREVEALRHASVPASESLRRVRELLGERYMLE